MAFRFASRWWPKIEFWPGSFAVFQGIQTSIAKKTYFLWSFRGLVRTSCPLWIHPCQSRIFQLCQDVSWVERVLNRVIRVLHKEIIWCLQRDSNQWPLYLNSSTLPLVDYTAIWSLYRHVVCDIPVWFKANGDRNQLWAWLDSDQNNRFLKASFMPACLLG